MTAFLESTVESLLVFLGDWSLRWAVLIAQLAVVLGLFRPRRAALRYVLCLGVLIAGLALPVLPRWGGGLPIPQPTPPSVPEPEAFTPPVLPLHHDESSVPNDVAPATTVVEPTAIKQHGSLVQLDAAPAPVAPIRLNWRTVLVAAVAGAWAVGVGFLLCRRLAGAWFLRRLRRTASPVAGPSTLLLAACRADLGLRRTVALATHPLVYSPVAFGLFRPIILVPVEWCRLPEPMQRGTLLHELAHLARGDDRMNVVLELVRIAFFFHPAVRWLVARLERERELLCDETALAHGVDRRDYAQMLLDFAQQPCRLGFPTALTPLRFGKGRTIKARISHLLEADMNRATQPLTARRAWAFGSLILACALCVGSFRVIAVEAANAQEPPPKAEPAKVGEKPPPTEKVKREHLRYGGKDFDQWRAELQIELKPEIRIDGIKALATFGRNGYGPEATAAILEVEKDYDVVANSGLPAVGDDTVYRAGLDAVRRIGAPGVPVLRDALASDNKNVRRFATAGLMTIGPDAKPAWAALVKALEDKDEGVRQAAVGALPQIDASAEELPALLARALNKNEKSVTVRVTAVQGMHRLGPAARKVVPALVEVLREMDFGHQTEILRALVAIKPDLKDIVGPLMEVYETGKFEDNRLAHDLLLSYGKDGGAAVPPLLALLNKGLSGKKDPNQGVRSYLQRRTIEIIKILSTYGPAAKEAVKPLEELATTTKDSVIGEAAAEAARKIKGE